MSQEDSQEDGFDSKFQILESDDQKQQIENSGYFFDQSEMIQGNGQFEQTVENYAQQEEFQNQQHEQQQHDQQQEQDWQEEQEQVQYGQTEENFQNSPQEYYYQQNMENQDQQEIQTSDFQEKKVQNKKQQQSNLKEDRPSNNFDYVSKKVLHTISEEQLKQQNQETIEDAYKQRKRQSFNILKEWDSQRDEFIQNHRKIAVQILEKLNEKINLSESIFSTILVFFEKIRAIQFANSKQLKENTPSLSIIDQKILGNQKAGENKKSKNKDQKQNEQLQNCQGGQLWYSELAKSIKSVDQVFENQFQQIQEFVQFLEIQILKEIFLSRKQYRSQIQERKKQLKQKQLEIQKCEERVKIKFLKYAKVFQEAVDSKQTNKKDLYNWEIKYRQEIKNYFQVFKEYGYQTFHFWSDVKKLEIERIGCIKKVFSLYIERSLKVYGVVEGLNQTLSEFQNFDENKQGGEMFETSQILTEEQIKFINQDKPKEVSTEECIQNFLYKFQFPDIESFGCGQHSLVLKKYSGDIDTGTFGLKWQPIELVFTIDDFLLIFDKTDKDAIKPSKFKMDCKNIKFQNRKKNNKQGNLCYVIEKSPGTFYNSEKKVLIKFKDYDQLIEFQIYLKRYGIEQQISEEDQEQEQEEE